MLAVINKLAFLLHKWIGLERYYISSSRNIEKRTKMTL